MRLYIPWLKPMPKEYNIASFYVKVVAVYGLLTPMVFSGMILAGFDIFIIELDNIYL